MAIDLLFNFSVSHQVSNDDGLDLFEHLLAPGEAPQLSFKATRDRVIFTDKRLIAIDMQGITGKKKEFRFFPYSKIGSYSIETAGILDADADFKIWVSGAGRFDIKFAKKLDVKAVARLLAEKTM